MLPVGCSLNIFCRVGLCRKMSSSRAHQGTVPGRDICASVCRLSEEDWSKALEFRECLDKLRKGQQLTEPAIRRLFHLLSDDGQPVAYYTLIKAFDWLGLQPHHEFLPQDGLVTEEVLVRMLTAECPQPVLARPTVSVPGPRMSDEDALRRGIQRPGPAPRARWSSAFPGPAAVTPATASARAAAPDAGEKKTTGACGWHSRANNPMPNEATPAGL